jgi:hypothetical protein
MHTGDLPTDFRNIQACSFVNFSAATDHSIIQPTSSPLPDRKMTSSNMTEEEFKEQLMTTPASYR